MLYNDKHDIAYLYNNIKDTMMLYNDKNDIAYLYNNVLLAQVINDNNIAFNL